MSTLNEVIVACAVRTAIGRATRGALRFTRPDELAATVIREALARVPALDPVEIEDVILGCAMPEGEQGMNLARIASLCANSTSLRPPSDPPTFAKKSSG